MEDESHGSLAMCPVCEELAKNAPRAPTTLPRIDVERHQPNVLAALTPNPDRLRHHSSVDRIAFLYDLEKSLYIECSFPDRTRHGHGVVFTTLCGQRRNIGRHCALKSLEGWGAIEQTISSASRYDGDLRLVQRLVGEDAIGGLLAELGRLRAREERLGNARFYLRQYFPVIDGEIRRRLSLVGGRRTEVAFTIPGKDADGKDIAIPRLAQLAGLSLWADLPRFERMFDGVRAMRAKFSAVTSDRSREDGHRAAAAARAWTAISDRVEVGRGWLASSSQFFGEGNLRVLCKAVRHDESVVVGDALVDRRGDQEVIVSGNGVSEHRLSA